MDKMGTIKVWFLVIFALTCNASILKIDEDFKYQRISVEVSDKVPRHLCQNTLDRLEELLSATSSQLYLSTRGKAAFDSISILLPSSWSGTDCLNGRPINDKISLDPRQTDFLVTNGHPIFGDQKPITLQYGQCGQTGLGIRIPHQLLSQSANLTQKTKLETFAEWVHYRYGTFSEVGSDLDPRYPAYHSNGLSEEPTISHGCNLTLDDEQMVDASILRNKAICDSSNDFYDRNAPTKQNLLCNRQAAQEVMLNHPDLQDINLQKKIRHVESFQIELVTQEELSESENSQPMDAPKPAFSYVLPSQKRHILVLDVSQNMNVDRQWEMARNALFRLINHVPTGDQIGIVTFGANARVNIEPTIVTESNREGLYGRIPFRLLNGQQGCLECGLRMAMQMVNYNYKTDILVLTATAGHGSNALPEIQDMVEELALPINLVSFEPKLNPEVVKLTKYGGVFGLQSQFIQQNLADTFLEILNRNAPLSTKVQKSYHRTFSLDHQRHETTTSGGKRGIAISGNFIVEENLRSNLWVVLTSPYKEDVELFEVTSPSGVPKVFPKFENGIVYFYLEGKSEPGIWSYKASLYPVSIARNEVTIEVFAQPTAAQNEEDDTFKVQAWTNVDQNGVKASEKPVIIYAQVTKGQDLPVMNAHVTAFITKPDSSVPYELVLNDRGTGYPDITSGDGIYSGYFTGFTTEEGLYSVDIKVTHNGGEASVPSLLNTPDVTLSSSGTSVYVPPELIYTTPTAQFTRYVKAVSFYVSQGVQYYVDNGQPSMEDIFPPSRVTDLKVQSMVNNTLYATLQWSAPGGDFDQGAAQRYDIRCYTNAEALSDTNFAEMGIPVHESLLPTPGILGDGQTATVGLPWANEVFYYGLVAIDDAGNRSPVSNLVPVYATEVVSNTENEVYVEESQGKALTSAIYEMVQGDNLYIILGVIAGMIVVITAFAFGLWCKSKHKRASEKRSQNARTQIFVNDLEANSGLPDLAPEKAQNYSEVWATHNSGLPTNASPTNSSLEEYANMYINTSHHRSYPLHTTVPVHEYRGTVYNETTVETPTYQNWNHKPPSDNGTATTSSTECYDDHNSDHSKGIRVAPLRRYSVDDYLVPPATHTNRSVADPSALSLSPSFCSASEKRRRQESLV